MTPMIDLVDILTRLDGETELEVSDGETTVRGCLDDAMDEVLIKFPRAVVDRMFIDDGVTSYGAKLVIIVKEAETERRRRK